MSNGLYIPKGEPTVKGQFYYAVRCPATGGALIVDEDASNGKRPFHPVGEVHISCHHCQTTHQFDSREVSSLQATGKE